MKVVIVYDRVNKWGGAERVLLTLHELYPKAPLYTSVYNPKGAPWAKIFPEIKTSFIQHLPFAKSNHEFLAPLMPLAFSLFDFSGYDLVISVTSEFAKNIKTNAETTHICYCLTPTRYLWSGYGEYFKNPVLRILSKPVINILRKSDLAASKKPDTIIAISSEVKKRIKKYYGRGSEIVFPPVNIPTIRIVGTRRKYYLLVSRLDRGYKKVDLAIRVFNQLKLPLVVVGTGREEWKLKRMAGRNIKFAGKVPEKKLAGYYSHAKALIMPQEEDFGIVAVEAQAQGVPVIAFNKGGARDTVKNGKTGVLFDKQTPESLKGAVLTFEKLTFRADNLHTNAANFSKEKFKRDFVKIVQNVIKRK